MNAPNLTVFHLDDDLTFLKAVRKSLEGALNESKKGPSNRFQVFSFSSASELFSFKNKGSPDIILLDYCLTDGHSGSSLPAGSTGLDAARECARHWPKSIRILFTNKSDRELIHQSHIDRSPVHDFFEKKSALCKLESLILSTYKIITSKKAIQTQSPQPQREVPALAGNTLNRFIQPQSNLVTRIIKENSSLLIAGENGVGKRILASALLCYLSPHLSSQRVNCRDQIRTKIDAVLQNLPSGILILEEISFLSLPQQAELLKALKTRRSFKNEPHKNGLRLIATLSQDPQWLRQHEIFLPDLLSILGEPIVIPPLRERPNEIDEHIDFWMKKQVSKTPLSIMNGALECLRSSPWKQENVTELFETLEQMRAAQTGTTLTSASLPDSLRIPSQALKMENASHNRSENKERISLVFDPNFTKTFDQYYFELLTKLILRAKADYAALGNRPSLRDLSRLFQISRSTLKRYLSEIEDRGYLTREELNEIDPK